jgi:hypothetical protein
MSNETHTERWWWRGGARPQPAPGPDNPPIPLPAIPTRDSVTAGLPDEVSNALLTLIDPFVYAPDWPTRWQVIEPTLLARALVPGLRDPRNAV